ncbi:hypothetical protein GO755_24775 [Spirosoma sp. HMF4905]|uniref:Uncharacterized protein n=1 Tax=Spirosoma arboris TaxID=2682092 RepID=A0A7K1SHS4_9BACT|nr:hypothetical protein [Spirosoma arboris]MVM33278.1 hypothetical protein [Spirosoma arboris]
MARFHLGALIPVAVRFFTPLVILLLPKLWCKNAPLLTPLPPEVAVQKCTSSATSTSTSSAPINKDIPITYIPTTNKAPVVPTFDVFWNAYDYKVGRKDCQKKWDRLPPEDKVAILTVLPAYV